MCGICGCAAEPPSASGQASAEGQHRRHQLHGPAGAAAAPRQLNLEQRLLAHNDRHAAINRERFRRAGLRVVNLLSAPGSGKTSLLEALARRAAPAPLVSADLVSADPASAERTSADRLAAAQDRPAAAPAAAAHAWYADALLAKGLQSHAAHRRVSRGPRQAVIVGDLATDNDAIRLRDAGLPALQINTGQGCHLEAVQVARALDRLEAGGQPLSELDLLWIENVGNLVCPAAFDLGEALRLVLLAVGEGEDKPLKYPALFHSADLVLISKLDLADAVAFRRQEAHRAIRQVAPRARILEVSARSGQGLAQLLELLLSPLGTGAAVVG